MNKQTVFRRTLIAAATALAFLGASATAQAVDEIEGQNDSLSSPQKLTIGADGSVTVNGVVGVMSGSSVTDVDFFSFEGKAGDMVTFDIDNGTGGLKQNDIIMFIFGPGINPRIVADDADASGYPVDDGSISFAGWIPDPYMVTTLPSDGTYTVAVTGYGFYVDEEGNVSSSTGVNEDSNGDYALIISGVTPPEVVVGGSGGSEGGGVSGGSGGGGGGSEPPVVQKIKIDVKTSLHALEHGKHKDEITVALLASPTFNPAADVNVSSLSFGLTGDERSLKKCDGVDRHEGKKGHERRRHLVCHFNADATSLEVGNLEGVLKGTLSNGTPFEGRDFLKVGKKKKRERHGRHARAGR